MPASFHRGDRVHLTRRAAESAMHGYCGLTRHISPDWRNRRGTVCFSTNPASSNVVIKWDDRRTSDNWPKGAVELICAGSDDEHFTKELSHGGDDNRYG
jgi:hypothetical protein